MLLTEHLTYGEAQVIVETKENGGGKDLFMRGIFVQGGVRNHNQRVYPVNEIAQAVNQINESLRRGESVLGEADHPEELTINLDRVSHIITEMYMDGNNGIGKLKIIPTPMGNICKTLLECGVKLGVSSRGSGNVDESGVVSDFEIVTVDIVAKPSAPEAYPKAVYEAFNWGRKGTQLESLSRAVMHDPKAQKEFKTTLLNWIDALR
jgi:hypothetical protein